MGAAKLVAVAGPRLENGALGRIRAGHGPCSRAGMGMRRHLSSGRGRWPSAAILTVSLVLASGAGAADRHVYLDTDGDGALND